MAARPLIGGMGYGHPNLRPGFNVKFGPPGWGGDLPSPASQYKFQTTTPIAGLVYPQRQMNAGRFLGQPA